MENTEKFHMRKYSKQTATNTHIRGVNKRRQTVSFSGQDSVQLFYRLGYLYFRAYNSIATLFMAV